MKLLFNIKFLRDEPDLVTISLARAVLCTRCRQVSNTRRDRCAFCDGETLVRVADVIEPPQGPPPQPAAVKGKILRFVA